MARAPATAKVGGSARKKTGSRTYACELVGRAYEFRCNASSTSEPPQDREQSIAKQAAVHEKAANCGAKHPETLKYATTTELMTALAISFQSIRIVSGTRRALPGAQGPKLHHRKRTSRSKLLCTRKRRIVGQSNRIRKLGGLPPPAPKAKLQSMDAARRGRTAADQRSEVLGAAGVRQPRSCRRDRNPQTRKYICAATRRWVPRCRLRHRFAGSPAPQMGAARHRRRCEKPRSRTTAACPNAHVGAPSAGASRPA